MSSPSPDKAATSSEIFARWLTCRERGDEPDFEKFLREHAAQAAELKRMHSDWQLAQRALAQDRARGDSPDASLAKRLQLRFGEDIDPHVSLRDSDERAEQASSAVMQRLSGRSSAFGRYQLKGEIARGGMGAIVRVWDEDLRRPLAMKVILGQADAPSSSATPPVETKKVARFLEEAQVTGQLDHPGIVPVHELGLDQGGRVYFTMKLVNGRDLKQIFDLVFEEKEGWSETRALSVMLRVCEAMAYAHSKGVIHRDLKPANIMVGSFGEVYVMDWGLARVLGRSDAHDIRLKPEFEAPLTAVKSERSEARELTPDSPLVTMDGDVMGTPTYMSPEQARGEIEKLSARSDVYSIGAMLYHLLARESPYASQRRRTPYESVLGMVVHGPPEAITSFRSDVPGELLAICEKAMSREADERYADTLALAEDLRAFLEHRVVGAYDTGTWAETKKWVERNKPLAASLAAAIVILVAGIIGTTKFAVDSEDNAKVARKNETRAVEQERIATQRASDLAVATKTAQKNEKFAQEQEHLATTKANDVLSLSAIQELKELVVQAETLWPAFPEKITEYDRWLDQAKVLVDGRSADPSKGLERHPGLKDHEAKLAEIRRRARVLTQTQIEADGAHSKQVEGASNTSAGASRPEHGVNEGVMYEFDNAQDRWWHAQLSQLVADLKAFTDVKAGLFSEGTSEQHGWGIPRRRNEAATVEERSVSGVEAKRRWDEAIAAIAKSEKYEGLKISPQLGLLPIGLDPASHLWEFAHVQTGDVPERRADGKLVLKESMGIVFVLIPAGKFLMGAQKTEPSDRNYDPQSDKNESPPHEVALDAYFLSKYEMTQGQWKWLTGRNPSGYRPSARFGDKSTTLLNPVEQVNWTESARLVSREGLSLPTEAQWEHAARALTDTPWWTGEDVHSLDQTANLADNYCKNNGGSSSWKYEEWLDDGFCVHAPIGSFEPNAFGLHDVVGNVWEWCRDGFGGYNLPVRKGDGERQVTGASLRVARGGSFLNAASHARAALRTYYTPEYQYDYLGLRPARELQLPASALQPQGK